MSEDTNTNTSSCASCGIEEIDDIKLKNCTACDLVRHCSDQCQKDHRSEHKLACEERAAELRDELLFKQPGISYRGDCPICMLPLQHNCTKSVILMCCSKFICNGCDVATILASMNSFCPFCREPTPSTIEEGEELRIKRADANDPVAMYYHGADQYEKGRHSKAFEWFNKTAELGNVEAHFKLAGIYMTGDGVEKDRGKATYHLEEAAIRGNPDARYDLGCVELENGNEGRAAKHFIIAANQGDDGSTKMLMEGFKAGIVSKEDLAAALRAHQAAVDATKSPQRETAEEFHRKRK